MAELSRPPVVVFDFDHTLTTFDTGGAFFSWQLKRDVWRVALLVAASPLFLPLLIFRRTRKWPVRIAIWVGTLGCSRQAIDALCEEFASEQAASRSAIFHKDGLARLLDHVSKGHSVIIATGTLETLASALLAREEPRGLIIIGSSMKTFLFGMIAREHCYGQKKVEMIESRGFATPWLMAYTDHESDFWLLENSHERYLVNPKTRAQSAFEKKFHTRPNVLHWS